MGGKSFGQRSKLSACCLGLKGVALNGQEFYPEGLDQILGQHFQSRGIGCLY
jgi:hypothetical protein